MTYNFDTLYQAYLDNSELHDLCNYPPTVLGFIEYCQDMLNECSEPDSEIIYDPSWSWVINNAPSV